MKNNVEIGVETANEKATLGLSVSGCLSGCVILSPVSENIFFALNGLLNKNALLLSQVTRIAVDCGPGSFTGIRIGLAFARTLGYFNKIRLDFYSGPDILDEFYRSQYGGKRPSFSVIRPYKDRYIVKSAKGRYIQCSGSELNRITSPSGRGLCGEFPDDFKLYGKQYIAHSVTGMDILAYGRAGIARPPRPIYLFSRRYKCLVKTS